MCDDRIAAVAKYVIDREFLLRQSPDEIFKIGIIRMNDCFHARKIHTFFGFSRKNRRRNAGKKGEMAGMLFHISGKKDITQ